MPFENHTTWKSSVEVDLDFESGIITLHAQRGGTAVPTLGETPERLRTSNLIPKVADSFPDNTTLLCNHVECNQTAPLLIEWLADYQWTTPQVGEGGGDTGVPPRWRISMQSVRGQHAIDRDINGLPIITVTREPYDPPLTEEKSDLAYVFTTENVPFNPTVLQMYIDAISSDVFMGHPPGSCKIDDISADDTIDSEGERQMNVQIRVVAGRPPHARNMGELVGIDDESLPGVYKWQPISSPIYRYTWRKRVLAEGYYVQDSGAGIGNADGVRRRRAKDDDDEDVVKAVSHRIFPTSGTFVGVGNEIKKPEDAQFYTWKTKPELPFQTLFQSI